MIAITLSTLRPSIFHDQRSRLYVIGVSNWQMNFRKVKLKEVPATMKVNLSISEHWISEFLKAGIML